MKKTVCHGLIPSFLVLLSDSRGRDNDSSKVFDIAVIQAASNSKILHREKGSTLPRLLLVFWFRQRDAVSRHKRRH